MRAAITPQIVSVGRTERQEEGLSQDRVRLSNEADGVLDVCLEVGEGQLLLHVVLPALVHRPHGRLLLGQVLEQRRQALAEFQLLQPVHRRRVLLQLLDARIVDK